MCVCVFVCVCVCVAGRSIGPKRANSCQKISSRICARTSFSPSVGSRRARSARWKPTMRPKTAKPASTSASWTSRKSIRRSRYYLPSVRASFLYWSDVLLSHWSVGSTWQLQKWAGGPGGGAWWPFHSPRDVTVGVAPVLRLNRLSNATEVNHRSEKILESVKTARKWFDAQK